jgi:HlyD family secretion protein
VVLNKPKFRHMNGMDKKIEKKKGLTKKTIWILVGVVAVSLLFYNIVFGDKSSKLNVDLEKISIEEVEQDIFQDYIAVQGVVEPIRTIYLDAVEGGRVEEKLREEGSMLKKGDAIIKLSNNNLILEISNTEAQVLRTINELRNARNFMQQQLLNSNIQILQLKKDVAQMKRNYEKNKVLFKDRHISEEDFKQSEEEYLTSSQLLKLQREYHASDSIYRSVQVSTLEKSVDNMSNNLSLAQKRLDNLVIKAPVDGELATLNPEIGEVVNYGTRVGTINILDSYKLRVEIDEHYVARVNRGLFGECDFAGQKYSAKIAKLYPEVNNGRFAVDMVFTEEVPSQMKIGQTSRIKLELGESQKAMLIPKGGFYQSTGGQWVYVLDPSGDFAIKRQISIGRQNPRYYEVIEGLNPGEKVIVSSYDNFGDADKLILKNKD